MRRRTHAEHEMYAQFRLAEALAEHGDIDRAAAELARPMTARGASVPHRSSSRWRPWPAVPASSCRAWPSPPERRGSRAASVRSSRWWPKGRTNREIGEALFISEKTASVHVSNILAKLGVTNRTEAAHAARDRGITDPS